LAVIKATGADTGGRIAIIELTEPPGAVAPKHVHHKEDEGFWVLEGEVTFDVGGTTIVASAGDYAFGPRDIHAQLSRRPRRLPDAFHRHARGVRGTGAADQRAGRGPIASARPTGAGGHTGLSGSGRQLRMRAPRCLT
jgi:Cupin domain